MLWILLIYYVIINVIAFFYQKEFLRLYESLARTSPPLRGLSLVGGGMNRYLFNI